MRSLWIAVPLLLAACDSLSWKDAPQREDPAPTGPDYLRAYKESYYRDLGSKFVGHLDEEQLLDEIERKRVVYFGDHHTDAALHARMMRLVGSLIGRGARPVLGLESVGEQDEMEMRRYLAGELDLWDLRRRFLWRWAGSWLDNPRVDTVFYRGLLRRAREHGLPVFALEPVPRLPLEERDAEIAERIERALDRHPDRIVVVVVGHTHLLGRGSLVERVGVPAVVMGARMSVTLRKRLADYPAPGTAAYLQSDAGVFLFCAPGAAGMAASRAQD